jgi:chromate transporter
MIRQELVEEERWISRERFNRVLAVYQALPGPEAHELCVYFGMLARGRPGAVLAGLGFMLPGFLLMLALSWWYVEYGADLQQFSGMFHGLQAAVTALIVRAVYRIGIHAVTNRWLALLAVLAGAAQALGAHFLVTLSLSGVVYLTVQGRGTPPTTASLLVAVKALPVQSWLLVPGLAVMFATGLRAGLLTFGGAYTVIPFLQHDAVVAGGWMTNAQFLDGLALSSVLPAPMVIVATFVGYVAGGPLGAVALTAGVFLPAFAFTLIGYSLFERVTDRPGVHAFLDGVTAGVVGLIAVTALGLLRTAVTDMVSVIVFAGALATTYWWRSRASVPAVVLAGGLIGLLV